MKNEQIENFLNNSKKDKIKDRIMIEWANINYKIKIKIKERKKIADLEYREIQENEDKKILNDINGFALPQEVLAIMGPSGCGKTSLLNIIAHRQLPTDNNHKITRDVNLIEIGKSK